MKTFDFVSRTMLFILMLSVVGLLFCSCGSKHEVTKNDVMTYRTLGSTGIQVSEIGLGCGAFSEMTPEESRLFMDVALDSGVNYIDIYDADPTVRSNIGYALKGRRDQMVIQGHVGCFWNGTSYERTRDVARAKQGFVDLLDLLGTDHIEVGMLHIVDRLDEWDTILSSGLFGYMKKLKEEGKIEHIGMSSHNVDVALAAAKSGEFEVIMFSLNPFFDCITSDVNPWEATSEGMLPGIDPKRVELYDYCAQHDIAITVMKVFGGGGRLLKTESSPLGFSLTPSQCISYSLAKPCVAVAIVGAKSVEELKADLHYLRASEAERDFHKALDLGQVATPYTNADGTQCDAESATVSKSSKNNSITTVTPQCAYCGHCAPCPVGINVAKVIKLYNDAGNKAPVPAKIQAEYDALDHHAGECIGCGVCEERCPFEVEVRGLMYAAAKYFGK